MRLFFIFVSLVLVFFLGVPISFAAKGGIPNSDNGKGKVKDQPVKIVCYYDYDYDGFGSGLQIESELACPPNSYEESNLISIDGDCDDTNAAINPNSYEIPDNDIDENCDGIIETSPPPVYVTCYKDSDSDLYGSGISEYVEYCSNDFYEISHFVDAFTDCDDTNYYVNPDAVEIPDNDIDENCDGIIEQTPCEDVWPRETNIPVPDVDQPILPEELTIFWQPHLDQTVTGYKLYYKESYSNDDMYDKPPLDSTSLFEGYSPIDVGKVTNYSVGLPYDNTIFCFAATVYTADGLEYLYTNIVCTSDPGAIFEY